MCQLEVGLPVVLEAARRSKGYFVLNAASAMVLPAELLERCDLVIINESEYALIPALPSAKLVAVTYGGDAVGNPSSQPELALPGHYVGPVAAAQDGER